MQKNGLNQRLGLAIPDLQGTWTNASLTNLERPDYYETLIVSDEEARATLRMSEEFSESVDNPYEEGESPQAGDNVGGYNVAWMDPGTDLFKLEGAVQEFHTHLP